MFYFMERNDFIKKFCEHIEKNKYINYENKEFFIVSMDLKEEKNDQLKLEYIKSIYSSFLSKYNIKDLSFLNKCKIEDEFDYDYAEENPDSDIWRYLLKLNLNIIYDNFAKQENKNNFHKIYRVESINTEEGMYSIGKNIKLLLSNKESNTPAPEDDVLLNHIFSKDVYTNATYKKEWFFGFNKIEDVNKWIGNKNLIELMSISGNCLVEYEVPKSFIIFGEKQLIFKKEEARVIKKINLNNIAKIKNDFK